MLASFELRRTPLLWRVLINGKIDSANRRHFAESADTRVAEVNFGRSNTKPKMQETLMPERAIMERARQNRREGKSSSTQAGEFVREEFHHIREGKHGARSARQAIAIGLSKARRAGVKLPPPRKGTVSAAARPTRGTITKRRLTAMESPPVRVLTL